MSWLNKPSSDLYLREDSSACEDTKGSPLHLKFFFYVIIFAVSQVATMVYHLKEFNFS